ncbi:MAG TPA: serpin family protein [Bacteroidales bacterium]|nr:serpin family protein [Bacteroidales bacterium]
MMKNFHLLFFTFILSTSFTGCENNKIEEQPMTPKTIELTPASEMVISGSNRFGIDLFTRVALDETRNLTLSPLSASAALTMLLNGTSGETFSQLSTALGYPETMSIEEINLAYKSLVSQLLAADPVVELALANAMFYRQDFHVKRNFVQAMESDFDATIKGLDFTQQSAVDAINKWASDNTKGKIPRVIDNIDPLMRLFLMNALYFKGNWINAFDKSQTSNMPFFLNDNSMIEVPTMSGKFMVRSIFNDRYHAVELPYGRGNFSMIVVVPQNQDLKSFLRYFTPSTWDLITSAIDAQKAETSIEIYLPRFQYDFNKTLNQPLKDMGIINAFDPNLADLSGISDVRDLFVHFVNQNTHIEVNEEGTTAAAVTTIGIGVTSVGPPPFAANRPFLFFIRERTTNTLMFAGQVLNPLD